MFGGAVVLTAMGFVQNVQQLLILRAIQGVFTGTIAAATALVACSTPRERAGYAMACCRWQCGPGHRWVPCWVGWWPTRGATAPPSG